MTFDDVVNRLLALFDTDQATAVSIANERQAQMIAEAEFRLAETNLGNTVAGQSDYNLPATVEDITYVLLGADTVPYMRASTKQMLGLRNGTMFIDNPSEAPGAFAPYADATGVLKVRIYPTPTVSGTPILAWSAIDAADTAYGTAAALQVPRKVHIELLDGCIAACYEQIESRWDLAQPHEQKYADGVEKLRRFKNARLGSGTTQIERGW